MTGLDPARPPIEMLASFGPGCSPVAMADARAYAVAFARRASENFVVLGRLLPAELIEDFAAVYTFCRWADDLGDETDPALGPEVAPETRRQRALELLSWFRDELHAERPSHPVLVALGPTLERHRIPKGECDKLISAFEQDQRLTRYETWEQLLGYCKLSADPVGRMVLMMAGLRPPSESPDSAPAWEMSDAICTALQLTNHLQDVRRDLLDRDRVYLPSHETGLDAQTLRAWAHTPEDPRARLAFIKATRPLIHRIEELYQRGWNLPSHVPGKLGVLIGMMAAGGRATLNRIERQGCITLWKRPEVGRIGKGGIALRGLASLYFPSWRNPRASSTTSAP
ncbi:MAG: squalene/phytoene synthase family protein [Phycisphaerales bacterium]